MYSHHTGGRQEFLAREGHQRASILLDHRGHPLDLLLLGLLLLLLLGRH
jgi:hypothetical protein